MICKCCDSNQTEQISTSEIHCLKCGSIETIVFSDVEDQEAEYFDDQDHTD